MRAIKIEMIHRHMLKLLFSLPLLLLWLRFQTPYIGDASPSDFFASSHHRKAGVSRYILATVLFGSNQELKFKTKNAPQ